MSPTMIILTSYSIPAWVLAGLTGWVGRERGVDIKAYEYVFIYLPFLFITVHVATLFGSIDNGVVEMGMHPVAVVLIAITGGLLGGASLIPRLFVTADDIKPIVVSSSSSFLVALFCLKMFFLAVVIANPMSLMSGTMPKG